MSTVWSGDSSGLKGVTVMVGVAGSGVSPGIGGRLRRLFVRLLVGFGLAGLVWLLTAAVHTATASAAETPTAPSTSSSGGDLLGSLVGSLTGTVTNTLDTVTGTDLGSTVTTVVGDVTTTATAVTRTTTDTVSTVTSAVIRPPVAAAKPVTHVVPVRAAAATPVQRHAVAPVPRAKTVVAQRVPLRHAVPSIPPVPSAPRVQPHRPVAPPLPAPAPQQPSPAVPATSVTSGHGGTGQYRHAVATLGSAATSATPTGVADRPADPRALAARGQALPATTPD
jgi:hypothetical protein